MGKHLDKSKVEQAFKQAAKTLASGDKDARAGRFVKRESSSGRFVEKSSGEKSQSRPKTR
jgi:hypothetical protein